MTNLTSPLPLFFISALHESGGGSLGRLLDGHPELNVYPFEMQLGTKYSKEGVEGYCFQSRYRWPQFPERISDPETLHRSIIDSELKRYLSDRKRSKFSSFGLELRWNDWVSEFRRLLPSNPRDWSRPVIVAAYLSSLFSCWKNKERSGREHAILGHCPVILFDAPLIFCDFPKAKMVHLMRNPLATFYDTRRRLPHLRVEEFCNLWNLTASIAFCLEKKYPDRFRRISYEELLSDRAKALKGICRFFGIRFSSIILEPSWNKKRLDRIPPFGGIPEPSLSYERFAQNALPERVRRKILQLTDHLKKICSS